MTELTDLILYFLNVEFYETALILIQYKCKNTTMYDLDLYLLLKALYKLKYFKTMELVIGQYPHILIYKEVKLICIKSGMDVTTKTTDSILSENSTLSKKRVFSIKYDSIVKYYEGLNQTERIRYDKLQEAFSADRNNTEALLCLFKEGMIPAYQFKEKLKGVKSPELREAITQAFNNINDPSTPIFLLNPLVDVYGSVFHNTMDANELFKTSVLFLDSFGDSEYIYFAIGLYYVAKKQYREAKKTFQNTVETNPNFGLGYLYLGITTGLLREMDNSIKHLEKAYLICNENPLPSYYLAHEYHGQKDLTRARKYYEKSIKFHGVFSANYAYFLVTEVDPVYINATVFDKKSILWIYYLLVSAKKEAAKREIENVEKKDADYWMLSGFLNHLDEEYNEAAACYQNSINMRHNTVAEELRRLAIHSALSPDTSNKASSYINCLLDTLPFKNRTLFVFL